MRVALLFYTDVMSKPTTSTPSSSYAVDIKIISIDIKPNINVKARNLRIQIFISIIIMV